MPSRRSACLLAALAALAAAPALARAESVVAVTSDGRVITFDTASPGTLTGNQVLTGVIGDLVAIDVRPANGALYGVTSGARLYRIDPSTGVATQVGQSPFAGGLGDLVGMTFHGLDEIRIVTESNRNLRVDPSDGSLIDGDPSVAGAQEDAKLAYAASDLNFGTDPTVVALAADGAANVFGIDSTLDALVALSQPAQGTLRTVGALGVLIDGRASLDVSATSNETFAVLTLEGRSGSGLYQVNRTTGGVAFAGSVGHPARIVAMTVGTPDGLPQPPVVRFVGLTDAGELVHFRSDAPAAVTTRVAVTGLVLGDTLVAIDTRPGNGRLYGLGSGGRIYVIDAATGAARPVRTAPFEVPLVGNRFSIEFKSGTGRLRVVSDRRQNLRVDADTGAVVDGNPSEPGVQGDTPLTYAPGETTPDTMPTVAATAFAGTATLAAPDTLFAIDAYLGLVATIGSVGGTPETVEEGRLRVVGPLGFDTSQVMGFEVADDAAAFAVLGAPGGRSRLFAIDLENGGAALIGEVGDAQTLVDFAVAPRSSPAFPATDLEVRSMVVRMNYALPDRDLVRIEGVLPVPAGTLGGRQVVVDVGGFSKPFVLGRRGKARERDATDAGDDDDTFVFDDRARDGRLGFTAVMRREDISDELADEGMGGTETVRRAHRRTVVVTVTVDGTTYSVPVTLRFRTRSGGTALAVRAPS